MHALFQGKHMWYSLVFRADLVIKDYSLMTIKIKICFEIDHLVLREEVS